MLHGLFTKKTYVPDSATIGKEMNTTRWRNVELESFVQDNYEKVKHKWKKNPINYEVLYTNEREFILNEINNQGMRLRHFYEGNLKALYNQFN